MEAGSRSSPRCFPRDLIPLSPKDEDLIVNSTRKVSVVGQQFSAVVQYQSQYSVDQEHAMNRVELRLERRHRQANALEEGLALPVTVVVEYRLVVWTEQTPLRDDGVSAAPPAIMDEALHLIVERVILYPCPDARPTPGRTIVHQKSKNQNELEP